MSSHMSTTASTAAFNTSPGQLENVTEKRPSLHARTPHLMSTPHQCCKLVEIASRKLRMTLTAAMGNVIEDAAARHVISLPDEVC